MDKKPEKLVPEVRFKGFTDDWEQRKLKQVANIIDPHPSHRAPKQVANGIPFIGISDVNEIGQIVNKSVRRVSEKVYEEHHKRYDLSKPSLGIGRVASLGKIIRLRNDLGKYAISPTLSVLQSFTFTNIDCLYASLNSEKFQNQFRNLSNGSTRQSVGIKDLREVKIYFPLSQKEQNLIGNVFIRLDKLITLQQRKLEQLKQLKKAMLQQLFVDKNNKQPILKFKNFRNNWREYKLGEIVNLEDNKRKPVKATERMRGEIPYYGANGIQDYVKGYTHIGKHVLIAEDGANSVDDYPIYFISSPSWINNHTHVLTAKQEILSSEFLSYALKKINYAKYLVGSGRYKLNAEILKLIPLQIPTMNEQKNIEINLSKIDKLISLQQNKLTQLTTLKKYLLQKMFI